MAARTMALTAELVARCHRAVADAGPEPGLGYLDEADYDSMLEEALSRRPPGDGLWLFAYGSLIWKPEITHVEERVAMIRGWHRAFCITMTRWRGTIEQPGLMLGLDRGGQCAGIAYRLPDGDARAQLATLFRREMTAKPATYQPRWLKAETSAGPLVALAFVANRQGRTYAGKRDDAEVAQRLAAACGHYGSGAEYLHNTVHNLEARGIHDRGLWRLQALVADAIAAKQ